MNNLFVNCNNCGQKLQIEDGIMFTTCQTCYSNLEIIRTFNSVYTKATEEIPAKTTSETALKPMELDKNDIYKRIELLDREWQNTLPTFMVKGSLPDLSKPKYNSLEIFFYISLISLVISGIIYRTVFIAALGLLGIYIFTLLNFPNSKNHKRYRTARTAYEQKRADLIKSLNE